MLRISAMVLVLLFSGILYSREKNNESKDPLIITIKPDLGFNVGLNQPLVQQYSVKNNSLTISNDPGIRLGIFADIKIQKRFTLLPKSELSFNYTSLTENDETYKLTSANLDFMMHAKFNLKKRETKLNPYIYFGPALRLPLNSDEEIGTIETQTSWSGDVGLGIDIDCKFFFVSPEIRYSRGLTNIVSNSSLEKIYGSYTAFVINFTGK